MLFPKLLLRTVGLTRTMVVRSVHVEARLAELGHTLPPCGAPKGSYALTSRMGSTLFLAGHLPIPLDGQLITGKVGEAITPEEANVAAKWCALNILSTLKAELGDLDKIVKIHKLVGFVNCVDGFAGQPGVVNGASDLLFEVFGEKHARSAVGTNALPLNVPVEIEAIVEIKPDD